MKAESSHNDVDQTNRFVSRHAPMIAGIFLLLLSVIVFFPRVTSFTGALFHFDLIGFAVPTRAFFFGDIAKGQFPFWSKDVDCGFPAFAEGQLGPLYPPNYLFFPFLPPWVALNASVIFHLVICLLGALFWLRQSHRWPSAVIGALAYTYSTYPIFHLIHLMLFQTACLLPWLFFLVDAFFLSGRLRDIVAAALVLALMLSTGHQQGPIIIMLGLAVYFAAMAGETLMAGRKRDAAITMGAGLVIVCLALCMTFVIVHSMLELLNQTVRAEALSPDFILSQSLTPDLFVRFASPAHHGRGMDSLWWLTGHNEKEMAVYLGLAAFIVAPAAFVGRTGKRERAHAAVLVFSLLYMMGSAGPFGDLISYLPILNRFRTPVRFIQMVDLSLAFLIASGLDRLLETRKQGYKRVFITSAIGAMCWAVLAWGGALYSYGSQLLLTFRQAPEVASLSDRVRRLVFEDLSGRSLMAVGMVLTIALLVTTKKRLLSVAACVVLGTIVFFDLYTCGAHENPAADSAIYGPFDTVDFLKKNLGNFRIYSKINHLQYGHNGWRLDIESYRYGIEGLPHNTPLLFGISAASTGSSIGLARNANVADHLNLTWLRRESVKYLLASSDMGLPVVWDNGRVKIHEVPSPAPLVGFAREVVPVSGPDEAFSATGKPVVDIVRSAYVEGISAELAESLEGGEGGRVAMASLQNDKFHLHVKTSSQAFLVLRSNYYPGWTAMIDGRSTKIYRANYLFQGIVVPPGTHDVVFGYSPVKYIVEIYIGLAVFLICLGLALFSLRFRQPSGFAPFAIAETEANGRLMLRIIAISFFILIAIGYVLHHAHWSFEKMKYPF